MCVCGGGNGQWWVEGEGQWDEAGGLRGQGPGRAACPHSPDGHLVSFPLSLLLTTVCQILPKGVVAVLGPSSSPASSSIISNICGEKEVSAGPGGDYLQAGSLCPKMVRTLQGWKCLVCVMNNMMGTDHVGYK